MAGSFLDHAEVGLLAVLMIGEATFGAPCDPAAALAKDPFPRVAVVDSLETIHAEEPTTKRERCRSPRQQAVEFKFSPGSGSEGTFAGGGPNPGRGLHKGLVVASSTGTLQKWVAGYGYTMRLCDKAIER